MAFGESLSPGFRRAEGISHASRAFSLTARRGALANDLKLTSLRPLHGETCLENGDSMSTI